MCHGRKAVLVFLSFVFACSAIAQTSDSQPPAIYKIGNGVSPPHAIYQPAPEYSEQARAAHYQGVVTLGAIVEQDGSPSHIRVITSLGMGLDEKAIEAVRQWRFEPARKEGAPVRVEIAVEVDFHLYGANDRKIVELTQKANSGDAKAQLDLAHVYFEGKDTAKNDQLGETYLERAAKQGLAKAQFEFGERLAQRDSPDYPKAYMWLALAQSAGYKHSDKAIKELSAKMTPEQLQSGRSLAEKWAPSSK